MSGYCPDCGNTMCLCDSEGWINDDFPANGVMLTHQRYDYFIELEKELEELKQENAKLREALEFYAYENNWPGVNDSHELMVRPIKWLRIVEDDIDTDSVGGKRARLALKQIKQTKEE